MYSKGQEYEYSENNELIIDDIRYRYSLEIEHYNFDESLDMEINKQTYRIEYDSVSQEYNIDLVPIGTNCALF